MPISPYRAALLVIPLQDEEVPLRSTVLSGAASHNIWYQRGLAAPASDHRNASACAEDRLNILSTAKQSNISLAYFAVHGSMPGMSSNGIWRSPARQQSPCSIYTTFAAHLPVCDVLVRWCLQDRSLCSFECIFTGFGLHQGTR